MLRQALAPVYRILEFPVGYAAIQIINRPTVNAFKRIIADQVRVEPEESILDIGCGIGNYRECFNGNYFGVDINSDYIAACRTRHFGTFETMDATDLKFDDGSFDTVVTVATTHHLDDVQVERMAQEAMRVLRPGGVFHVIDAVLPASALALFKNVWFRLDRGRHPRKQTQLVSLIGADISRAHISVEPGPMHDAFYAGIHKGR